MAILSVEDFCAGLAPGLRLLALDVGDKTIGLASAVVGQDLIMPLKTLMRRKFTRDAADLAVVIQDYDVAGLVVGWPLLPDGRAGKRCQSVRDFTAELDRYLQKNLPLEGGGGHAEAQRRRPGGGVGVDVPITFWDERFSTHAGDAQIDEIGRTAGKSVRGRRDAMIDSLAAQQILRDFVERNGV